MRTVLILNPASGASTLAEHDGTPQQHEEVIVQNLQKYGIEPEVWYTTLEDPGMGLAQRAAQEGADLVIAAGGDGTIHAVACGLIGSESALGIIAMGTMNNIARSLSLPESIEEMCAIIAQGETGRIDVGQIGDDVFLEVAGIGLEAALFPAAEEVKSPGILSTIKGVIDGLTALLAYKPPRLRIAFDDHKGRLYDAIQVTVCNSPYYGVHLQVAPGTLMDDGLLDVVIYRHFSKLEYIRHAISISQGRRVYQPKIARRKVKSLRVISNIPVDVHADGVPHGQTPVTIAIKPGVLRVRIPQHVATGPSMSNTKQQDTQVHKKAKAEA